MSTDTKTYAYQYYKHDQLKEAKYSEGSSFDTNVGLYNEESVTYDVNGNIKTLQRKGKNDLGVAATIDNLAYTYSTTNTNALVKIEDSGTTAGFNNGATDAAEFTYDANGNATKDKNKDITAIAYNSLGKPKQVTFGNGRILKYSYDASGVKIKLEEYQSATLLKTTKYVGGYVYENDTLKYFGSPEGRVVVDGSTYEYQYAISDHQGNTRTVFTAKDIVTQTSFTDFESTSNASFQNYPTGGNRSVVNLYDHTDAGTAKTYSTLLNGGYNSQVGVAKSFKVYPGDILKIEAYAKYSNPTSNSSNVTAFASALLSAFGVPAPGMGEAGTMSSGLNGWGSSIATGHGNPSSDPKIFVNIILFDKNFNLVEGAYDKISSAAEQVGVSPVVAHEYMVAEKTVEEEGYAFLYISNENDTRIDAYFDDVKMSYTPSRVVQHSDFYAFGLQTDNSWTRGTNVNKYLYNSGSELNKTTGSYEMYFRNYDPAIARMSGVDVMADSYSSLTPYQYANNSPVYFSDPTGAWSSQYESARNGGCGCWKDSGAQDGGGNANFNYKAYGSMAGPYGNGSAFGLHGVNYNGAEGTNDFQAFVKNRRQQKKDAQAHDGLDFDDIQMVGDILKIGSMAWQLFDVVVHGGKIGVQAVDALSGGRAKEFFNTEDQTLLISGFWIDSGQNAMDILGALFGAAQGLVVSKNRWLGSNGKYYSDKWGGNQYTGSRAGAYRAAGRFGTLGKITVGGTLILGGISVHEGYLEDGKKFGYNAQSATARTVGGVAGGWAGAEAGATIGAAIGVWFGGVGAIPGAVIGGVIGGIAGGLLGSSIGQKGVDYYHSQ